MKFSTEENPAPIWNVPWALRDLDVDVHLVVARAALRRDVDLLEEAQRRHAPLRVVQQRLVVGLALDDAQLAADDLVARLRVAADVDAIERDQIALLDLEGDVDGARLLVDGRGRRRVDVGVALVLVVVRELLQIVGQLRAVEDLAPT